MSDRIKGVIIGVSNVFVTMVAFACLVGVRQIPSTPEVRAWSVRPGEPAFAQLLAFVAVMFGAFAGAMLGSISASTAGLKRRTLVYIVLSLLMVAVIAPIWPAMLRYAIPSTIVHAVVLAHWTAPPPPAGLPKAVVWKKP